MKKIYWRPRAVSRPALVLISLISIAGLMVVERFKVPQQQAHYAEKIAAADLAQQAFAEIKIAREESGEPIKPAFDPTLSGLVGLPMSPVTSVSGEITAKQTSINPNYAAVIVAMLIEADVHEGDFVAVGTSGSFPALNICTIAACEAMKVHPVVIASASASQWGANVPQLMWLDMEDLLIRKGIFKTKSIAASIGGYEDQGLGLTDEGRKLVKQAIERNGIAEANFIDIEDFSANVDRRMKYYYDEAKGLPVKAYVNVGGGAVSVGRNVGKRMFHPGVNMRPPRHVREIDGVMPRFILAGTPVIHLVHINSLATQYGLPLSTSASRAAAESVAAPTIPSAGQGGVFTGIDYSKPLVLGVLAFILMSLYGFIRSDVGFRLLKASQGGKKRDGQPEPMV